MIIKKFLAKSEKDAIEMAKNELGNNAIVMNIKKVKPKGLAKLFVRGKVEVTAALDETPLYSQEEAAKEKRPVEAGKFSEAEKKEAVKKSCQRTFQALRIDVNREFEVLYEFMEKLPDALKPGGRAAILTFHSGEDKLVKKALKAGYKAGIYSDYAKDVIRPSAQECAQNGRARSTKMRWAIKA